jgi:hypothetical protein
MKKRQTGSPLFPVKGLKEPTRIPGPSEDSIQKNVIVWWRTQYPRFVYLLFHIPNGGKRDKITASIFKGLGVVPGVADLFLAIPNPDHHGFFIELKRKGNVQSEYQINFMKWVRSMGYKYEVIDTVEDAIQAVQTYLKPTHYFKPGWADGKVIHTDVNK